MLSRSATEGRVPVFLLVDLVGQQLVLRRKSAGDQLQVDLPPGRTQLLLLQLQVQQLRMRHQQMAVLEVSTRARARLDIWISGQWRQHGWKHTDILPWLCNLFYGCSQRWKGSRAHSSSATQSNPGPWCCSIQHASLQRLGTEASTQTQQERERCGEHGY